MFGQISCVAVDQSVEQEESTASAQAQKMSLGENDLASSSVQTMTLLIGRCHSGDNSTTGRATRGYVAFYVEGNHLVYLKDSWREDSSSMYPELDVYKRLAKHKVPCIATALGGGDVSVAVDGKLYIQRTLSQNFLNDEGLLSRVHCRLVSKQLGIPLSSYRDSLRLLLCVMCAYQGTRTSVNMSTIYSFTSINQLIGVLGKMRRFSIAISALEIS